MNYGNTIAPLHIECPVCKNKLKNQTGIQAITIVCNSCNSILDTRTNTKTGKINNTFVPLIPLGAKGKFNDITYEVTGYIKFRQYRTIYTWNEYTLFNPIHGYAFLSEYNGHWSFVKQTDIFPFENKSTFIIEGKTYSQYNDYKTSIEYATGEFYWNILEAEQKKIIEFLSPPYMLIREISPTSLTWFKAEHIEQLEVSKKFDIKKSAMPARTGVGAMSPPTLAQNLNNIGTITFIFIIALFISQVVISMLAQNKEVFSRKYQLDSLNAIVTPSFKLENSLLGKTNLEVELYAGVDNSWFETAITLVNDVTGEEFSFEEGVEYYHGYDGEYWSEGGTTNREVLSQIPDGTYHMNITPYIDNTYSVSRISNFTISLNRDVVSWSNFFWYFFGIIIYPIILYFRNESHEYQRWL